MLGCPTIQVNDNVAQEVAFTAIDFRSQYRGYRLDGFPVRLDKGGKSADAIRIGTQIREEHESVGTKQELD
jgi:hypothetical protein